MKTTKNDLVGIWNALEKFSAQETSRKFAYGILKNRNIIRPEIEALKEVSAPPATFQEFESRRQSLLLQFCDKNEDNTPMIDQARGQYVMEENKEAFEAAISSLTEEYKEAIDEFNNREAEFKDILEEEIEFEPFKIKFSSFPETISVRELELLEEFIEYDED